jgi:tRNA uridine 5-carbamoylmethylation protein Kti12
MLFITAGYPFSGKTEFAKCLVNSLAGCKIKSIHIDPSTLRPNEYGSMSQKEQEDARISAWEVSLELLDSSIKAEPTSTIIIFDTCAAKARTIMPYITSAKNLKHSIYYAFVGSILTECKARGADKWPAENVVNNYATDFGVSVSQFRKISDRFFFIKNTNDNNRINIKNAVSKIIKIILNGKIDRISKPEPIRSTIIGGGQKENQRTKVRKNRTI